MTTYFEGRRGEFLLSTDPARLDFDAIHAFLSQTYWGRNRSREILELGLRHSLCFGVYREREQVGFARAITDCATFGYLADVFILEPYRGQGLGRWLVESVLAHPELREIRRWALLTRDMHALYEKCGFTTPERPGDYMEKTQPYPQ
jgi:GNAT superfamily N-acetyltransferase